MRYVIKGNNDLKIAYTELWKMAIINSVGVQEQCPDCHYSQLHYAEM